MTQSEVTGKTQEEVDQMREDFKASGKYDDFDKVYCLANVKSPDWYDGPPRYCTTIGHYWTSSGKKRCKFHCGPDEDQSQNLYKLAGMTHGMSALREHIRQDFDEKDRALYDWIIDRYTDAYDLDLENDPNTALDLHKYAVETVRGERGRGHLIKEGEVNEDPKISEEGNIVLDEDGQVVTEKSEHYLANMIHRQDKKLLKMEKEMGLTRKEQKRQSSTDDAVEAIKDFSKIGAAFLDRGSQDYDPDEKPWEQEEDS